MTHSVKSNLILRENKAAFCREILFLKEFQFENVLNNVTNATLAETFLSYESFVFEDTLYWL